jgi:hypothetical protein
VRLADCSISLETVTFSVLGRAFARQNRVFTWDQPCYLFDGFNVENQTA